MSRAQYALLNYLSPFLWILTAELWQVFHGRSDYTITFWITSIPSSLFFAVVTFVAVWLGVHGDQTYATKKRQRAEKLLAKARAKEQAAKQ